MATTPSWRDLTFKTLRTDANPPGQPTDGYGFFEGYLAVFDNTDSYKDVIRPGAFAKTIQEAKARQAGRGAPADGHPTVLLPLLWQHQQATPIGGWTDAHEDDHGLFVRGFVDLDTVAGREAYSGMKKGYSTGLSIGYRTVKDAWKGDTRNLLEVHLLEGSLVTMPANEAAQVTAVKMACGKSDWPLAPRDHPWDAGGATQRLEAKATEGNFASLMAATHFYKDETAPADQIGSYKLPFCDVIGGDIQAVPKGIFAVKQRLGATGIPAADKAKVQRRVSAYYQRMAEAFDDEDITPKWDSREETREETPEETPEETREPIDTPASATPARATIKADKAPETTPDAPESTPAPAAATPSVKAETPDSDWLLLAALAGLHRTMRRDLATLKSPKGNHPGDDQGK